MPDLILIASLVGGLIILALSGDFLVSGSLALARRLGIPPLVAGIFIVGFGTSAPEMVVSLNAAIDGRPGLALGNIVGSNIANVFLVLALPALIRPFATGGFGQRRTLLALFVATAAWIGLTALRPLTWPAGVFFLFVLIGYCGLTMIQAHRAVESGVHPGVSSDKAPRYSVPHALLFVPVGIVGLMIGAQLLIYGGVGVAESLNVPEEYIGLTLLAVGTSLPEIAAGLAAAVRGRSDVLIGDVLGSNLFNILGAGELISLFGPIQAAPTFQNYDHWFMAFGVLILGGFILRRARVSRLAGMALLLIYAIYVYGLVSGFNLLGLFRPAAA